MKKIFGLIAVFLIACFAFAGCAEDKYSPADTGNNNSTETEQPNQPTENKESTQSSESGQPEQPSETEQPAPPPESEKPEQEEITKMFIAINGNKLEVTLAENSSVDALVEILKKGDITFTADENGNFEMYGDIGHSLPANNTHISAQAGDVILYAGRYLCLFFGNNSYSYTAIGKINGYSASELRTLLGAEQGSVQVTISLS